MKLKEFLEENRLTMRQFAIKANVTEALISNICNHKKDVFLSVALRISEATGGEVSLPELITEDIRKGKVMQWNHKKPIPQVLPKNENPYEQGGKRIADEIRRKCMTDNPLEEVVIPLPPTKGNFVVEYVTPKKRSLARLPKERINTKKPPRTALRG